MKTTSNQPCFARNHMTPDQYAVWDYARSVSYDSGVFYLDGRAVANQYKGLSKNTVYKAAAELEHNGWFTLLAASTRNKTTGRMMSTQYETVSHDDWVRIHGTSECRTCTSPSTGTGNALSLDEPSPVPRLVSTSPSSGTYIGKDNLEKKNREKNKLTSASFPSGMGQTKESEVLELRRQMVSNPERISTVKLRLLALGCTESQVAQWRADAFQTRSNGAATTRQACETTS